MPAEPSLELPESLVRSGARATRAIVDLDAIEANIQIVRHHLTAGTHLIAVVKANGYGHGALFVARAALNAGASMLAVAAVGEGIALRRQGIRSPILILGPVDPSQHQSAIEHGLTLTVSSFEMAERLDGVAEESGRTAHVHLKIDTGMRRFGCRVEDAAAIAHRIAGLRHLWLEGVFTHFAAADEADESFTLEQAEAFDRALTEIAAAGVPVQIRHAANSAAALRSRRYDYDAIRLGIAMYGLPPSGDVPLLPGMRPALTLTSRIARLFELEPGHRVSYGGTYEATRRERVALIPCGYADGYRRALSNRGWLARGDACLPIRGRICMDQLIVGLPDAGDFREGDQVTLIGTGGDAAPTAVELADRLGTISYEVATDLAARVPRVYLRNGQVTGIEDLTGPATVPGPAGESH